MKKIIMIITCMILSFICVSCEIKKYEYVEGKVNIVVTTTMLADLTKELGKERVNVKTLMEVGVDPHSFEPRPSDVRALIQSDLIIANGLHLEAKLLNVLDGFENDKLLNIGKYLDESKLIYDENGQVDPHIWFDIDLWMDTAKIIKDRLIAFDKECEDIYEHNYRNYVLELNELKIYVLSRINELNIDKRILVTAHDAFSYFGKAYDFQVYSIQGISTETEASAKDIESLANFVVLHKVNAIFIESSVPYTTIESVIQSAKVKGHNLKIGGELHSDSLGSNEDDNTYIKMVKKNVDTIVDNLK